MCVHQLAAACVFQRAVCTHNPPVLCSDEEIQRCCQVLGEVAKEVLV